MKNYVWTVFLSFAAVVLLVQGYLFYFAPCQMAEQYWLIMQVPGRCLNEVSAPATAAHLGPDGIYPNLSLTPGAIDPRVTQDNIKVTICTSGYTATVRPPISYTNKIKLQSMAQYKFTGIPGDYELDHLISLELGGAPSDPNNLWPEKYAILNTPGALGARQKDRVETYLHSQVCNGSMTLAEAQKQIVNDWYAVYTKISAASQVLGGALPDNSQSDD